MGRDGDKIALELIQLIKLLVGASELGDQPRFVDADGSQVGQGREHFHVILSEFALGFVDRL